MTTWHAGEPEEDVARFALDWTSFEEYNFTTFLILVVGSDPTPLNRFESLIFRDARATQDQ